MSASQSTQASLLQSAQVIVPRPRIARGMGADQVEQRELRRLAALTELGLMHTEPEPEFDALVTLAADLCEVPICVMTLIAAEEQTLKSSVGFPTGVMSRAHSFCNYTILQEDVLTVPDAWNDKRFQENPFVTGDPHIRFYAGAPVRTEDGSNVGTLCVVDTAPRTLTVLQERTLRVLAEQISARLQLRTRMRTMETLSLAVHGERELFRSFLDSMPMETYLKNSEGQLLFYNRQLATRFGIDQHEWLGKTSFDLWPLEKAEAIRREEEFVMQTGRAHESYVEIADAQKVVTYWKTVKAPIRGGNGELLLANVSVDLTEEMLRESMLQQVQDELEEANRKLRSLALTDELTGLWNRRAFDARLETEIMQMQRKGRHLALLMIDIDNFKLLNDTFGHSHGDEVLRQFSEGLRRCIRGQDVAARFGGEEFALILPETDLAGACLIGERIAERLHTTVWSRRAVTASVGVAIWATGQSGDDLLDMADAAMYQAKHDGKDCMRVSEKTPRDGKEAAA